MTNAQRNKLMKKLFLPPVDPEGKSHGAVFVDDQFPAWVRQMLDENRGKITEEMLNNLPTKKKDDFIRAIDESMIRMAQTYVNEIMEICNEIMTDNNRPVEVRGSYIFRGVEDSEVSDDVPD